MLCGVWLQRSAVVLILLPHPWFRARQFRHCRGTVSGGAEALRSVEDLQKATQNPVSSVIGVRVQNTSNLGIGPLDRAQNISKYQPVIPTKISGNINLIIRLITPVL